MGNVDRGVNKKTIPVSSSMPTNDQRVGIANKEKKGFSVQTKRFPSQVFLNGNPGPASYGVLSSVDIESPSFSKKGTAGFVASKPPRDSIEPRRGFPGPDTYNLQGTMISKNKFGLGFSRVFRLPVAVQLEGPKHKTPGPDQYDVRCDTLKSLSSVNATSTFLSKTGRNSIYRNQIEPSPCHYEVSGVFPQKGSRAALSPFKSKTQRTLPPVNSHVPGPGAYSPGRTPAPVKRTVLPRGFHLTISSPAISVPKDPDLPGPAHYDISGQEGLYRLPMPTAAFASKTDRIPYRSDMSPGPAFYDPQILPKPCFFYNNTKVWLPM